MKLNKARALDFMCDVLIGVSTAAPCRRSCRPRPSAAPPRRKGDDPERRRSSALCALTADTDSRGYYSLNDDHFIIMTPKH